mmetsp:Transcript_9167/g.16492  ORF Transcript_9167/g.16492 Transcript_9167/m.16492 type:complete len:460 (+) Transcript_9167:82-1461(+)
MVKYDDDLVVVGAGSGGVRAARISAGYGARVAIVEFQKLGGTCVNVGCVPKKLFVYGSHYGHTVEESKNFGWNFANPSLDWPSLIENKNHEILRLNGVYDRLLKNAGVEIINGFGSFTDAHTIEVSGESVRTITAEKILIATGSTPFVPEFPGREHVITSNEAFYFKELPKKVVIVGGGYIAVEFACILANYGANVTLVYRGDLFLRGFDVDVRKFLLEQMQHSIDVRLKNNIKEISVSGESQLRQVTLADGSVLSDVDVVMYATGRVPMVQNLGLETIGVAMGKKNEILVDEYLKTSVDSIFAVGDVIDRMALTPVALREGHAFADTQFGKNPRTINYENIPTAVFAQPPIGTCGMTEDAAVKAYGEENIDVYVSTFKPLKHTLTNSKERSLYKLIVHAPTDKVIGCHMVESSAGEVIQIIGIAMKAGATKADFDATVGVHPTSAEELVTMRTKRAKD